MIKNIKSIYGDPDPNVQNEIHEDAIYLFTANMTSRFFDCNQRLMSTEEIKYFSDLFRDHLRKQNG